jgi:hypothetical protein
VRNLIMEKHLTEYWIVYDNRKERDTALVKATANRVQVIAGDASAVSVFVDGKPDLNTGIPVCFQFLTNASCHPFIGECIEKLGPVENSQDRLDKTNAARKKQARAKALSQAELEEIGLLKNRGVSQRRIAERFGVSRAYIQRYGASDPPTL